MDMWKDKKITYKIKYIYSVNFGMSSIWNLADNLAEGLDKGKCMD